MKKILLLALIFISGLCNAQNYSNVDTIVDRYPKNFKSVETLASWINQDFQSDAEKVRAAYYWLASNIEYHSDLVVINPSFEIYFSEYQKARAEKLKAEKKIEETFSTKKANCLGYALSLKSLCDRFNIENEVVTGIAKCDADDINDELRLKNHAWNAVKLNNKWELIDISWATGYNYNTDLEVQNVPHHYYYLTEPNELINHHYPSDKKWQLLEQPISLNDFLVQPILYPEYHTSETKLLNEHKGIYTLDSKDGYLTLFFEDINANAQYHYLFKSDDYASEISFVKIKENLYKAKIKVPKGGFNSLAIYADLKPVVSLKVNKL